MKNTLKIALGAALGAAMFAGGAAAAPEVEGGDQLVTTCQRLLEGGSAPGSEGEPCKDFVTGMIMSQEDSLTVGEPFKARRIGPNEDETACFEMPDKLSFRDFATQVVSYAEANPGAAERPAFELAARALEAKYPCDPEDLKEDAAGDPRIE
ncbi:MAG: Rap1a/Tai family immunity protein [Parvibaculum sp.]|uniref:Rap1a/Tai family immunity protein n=1 Tax=Parvibaculum sp. TaxID=2024848 RepID=UPI0032EC4C21